MWNLRVQDLPAFFDPETEETFRPASYVYVPKLVSLTPGRDALSYSDLDSLDRVYTPVDVLLRFTRLKNALPQRIERFAKRWGVLGVTKKGVVVGYSGRAANPEPVEQWRLWAECLDGVLQVASNLYEDVMPSAEHWARLPRGPRAWHAEPQTIEQARQLFSLRVLRVVKGAKIWTYPYWSGERWELGEEHVGSLFGALACQLVLLIGRANAIMQCSECGFRYLRTKKRGNPAHGNYCLDCEGSSTERVRRYRAKKRAGEECN